MKTAGCRAVLLIWVFSGVGSALAASGGATGFHCAYRSFLKQDAMTTEFARLSITTRCFFAANTLNSLGEGYCQYPLIWKGPGQYDFSAFDAQVRDLLAASPNADFLCIIDLNTPLWGVRRFWGDSFHDITHLAVNEEWRTLTEAWLTNMLVYAEAKYGSRMRGYILSGGGTSEWYEINFGKRSRAKDLAWCAWCRERGLDHSEACPDDASLNVAAFENTVYDPATESAKIDYWRFHNSICPEVICRFAKTARKVIPAKRELGVFFGYALESNDLGASFAHLGYERVYACPEIDFVISPGNYSDRGIGAGSGSQLPHGTAKRFGKRLLHEIDFAPHGNRKWKAPWKTLADDLAGDTREAAFAIASHSSFWWFDMWGGFYDDPVLRERIGRLAGIARRFAADDAPSSADVLLVCDPQSMCYVNERTREAPRIYSARTPIAVTHFRNALARSGAVFDVVSFNDLAAIDLSPYRMICLPGTIEITPERAKVLLDRVCRPQRTVVWSYVPGLSDGRTLDKARVRAWAGVDYGTRGISSTPMPGGWTAVYAPDWSDYTPERLKRLTAQAGCWACTDDCSPVFANRRFLAVHVQKGGRRRLRLKERVAKVIDLLTDATVGENLTEFEAEFSTPDTRLYELVNEIEEH